ncbi:V4R domain-containing protein [Lentibacillus cibarius]|uniref:4-vinyl reductase n=1 Tax=Lentibacillus cibarius TaxID=2583219 RepID=A0A5S3QNX2_9BACI|nr:V4R domain-containing protein [Lentibacillus cibarius]TMN23358.1 4-vinyl reductase [Lentibacillus cibarius]
MDLFTFNDMTKINRTELGDEVPLELFRAIRLIGMYQGLPMEGKTTTLTVGRKIGRSIPADTVEQFLDMFKALKIGAMTLLEQTDSYMLFRVYDCFCSGLPVKGKKVCDLEGAILEGALKRILNNNNLSVYESKCNINGDDYCEYTVRKYNNIDD